MPVWTTLSGTAGKAIADYIWILHLSKTETKLAEEMGILGQSQRIFQEREI